MIGNMHTETALNQQWNNNVTADSSVMLTKAKADNRC